MFVFSGRATSLDKGYFSIVANANTRQASETMLICAKWWEITAAVIEN